MKKIVLIILALIISLSASAQGLNEKGYVWNIKYSTVSGLPYAAYTDYETKVSDGSKARVSISRSKLFIKGDSIEVYVFIVVPNKIVPLEKDSYITIIDEKRVGFSYSIRLNNNTPSNNSYIFNIIEPDAIKALDAIIGNLKSGTLAFISNRYDNSDKDISYDFKLTSKGFNKCLKQIK